MTSGFQCAGCGEWSETVVEPFCRVEADLRRGLSGLLQANVLRVTWDKSAGEYGHRCGVGVNLHCTCRCTDPRPASYLRQKRSGNTFGHRYPYILLRQPIQPRMEEAMMSAS
jgi:hypothetical protein